ncbi:MAG: hypothetical protein RBJ76_28100 [Stenomitos frigidus ULC029]
MSVLYETDLTEYARQCTLQRRRYEECVQNAQGSIDQSAAIAACSINQASDVNECLDHTMQGCVIDCLELSVEPLAWEDKQPSLSAAGNEPRQERQWQDDRSPFTQPHSAGAMRKNVSPVSYGAP